MGIDFARIFTAVKEEPKWVEKSITLGVICLLSTVFLFASFILLSISESAWAIAGIPILILSIILSIYITGYIYSTGNKIVNLPMFSMSKFFENNLILVGIKSIFAIFIYSFLLCLIFVLSCFTIILAPVGFIVLIIFPMIAMTCYTKTLKIKDCFSFRKHFMIFKENTTQTLIFVGYSILLSIIMNFLMSIAILFIPLLFWLYLLNVLIWFNLVSQYAKEIDIDKYLTVN